MTGKMTTHYESLKLVPLFKGTFDKCSCVFPDTSSISIVLYINTDLYEMFTSQHYFHKDLVK